VRARRGELEILKVGNERKIQAKQLDGVSIFTIKTEN
jgi:hypothetical protein